MVEEQVPTFVGTLNVIVLEEEAEITNSTDTIAAIVQILNNVANISTAVTESVVQVGCLCICPDLLYLKKKQLITYLVVKYTQFKSTFTF